MVLLKYYAIKKEKKMINLDGDLVKTTLSFYRSGRPAAVSSRCLVINFRRAPGRGQNENNYSYLNYYRNNYDYFVAVFFPRGDVKNGRLNERFYKVL